MAETVLITGAARGIGSTTARTFRDAGWHVVGVDRGSSDRCDAVSCAVAADAADPGELASVFTKLRATDGRLVAAQCAHALLREVEGAIDAAMRRASLGRDHGRKHVMGRVGQATEAAQVVLHLADGERSSFITGQAITVGGGATARLSAE